MPSAVAANEYGLPNGAPTALPLLRLDTVVRTPHVSVSAIHRAVATVWFTGGFGATVIPLSCKLRAAAFAYRRSSVGADGLAL